MTPKEYWNTMRSCRQKSSQPTDVRVHHITEDVYGELAIQLVEQIGNANYISNIRVSAQRGDVSYKLTVSAVIYWRDIAAPEGNYSELEKIVPIWWEQHSYEGDDQIERINDATFDKITEQIIAL